MPSWPYDQRPHHVVFLMFQGVAVPDVSMASMRELCGTTKGAVGKSNFMMTVVHSPGFMRTVSLKPASFFVRQVDRPDETNRAVVAHEIIRVECPARQHLHIDQMKANRVRVTGEIKIRQTSEFL